MVYIYQTKYINSKWKYRRPSKLLWMAFHTTPGRQATQSSDGMLISFSIPVDQMGLLRKYRLRTVNLKEGKGRREQLPRMTVSVFMSSRDPSAMPGGGGVREGGRDWSGLRRRKDSSRSHRPPGKLLGLY